MSWLKDRWNSPSCQRARRTIIPFVILTSTMIIGYSLIHVKEDASWLTISQLHANWNHTDGYLSLSMLVTKRIECNRVVVSEHMVRIFKGSVAPSDPVVLDGGDLDKKLRDAPVGESEHFDRSYRSGGALIERGNEYQLILIASCEDPAAAAQLPEVALVSMPVRKIMFVARQRDSFWARVDPRFS